MSKHTPGPWTVGTWMDHRLQTHPDGLTRGQFQIFPIPSDDEAETIARLIAAAPTMLKVLEDFATAKPEDLATLLMTKLNAMNIVTMLKGKEGSDG